MEVDLTDLIGDSAAMATVRSQVARFLRQLAGASRPPTLLLEGETGTGKGLLARLLHRFGPRSAGPFIDVNCAAIPETLLEAELFGFERGAFTDARQSKSGLFQAAHGGVLFLDEIALLPLELQAKLLTVLEERTIRRLGAIKSAPVDVWVIAASNEDLHAASQTGRVRGDLYHRIARVTLHLPPLREREGDVRLLAERFLARVCTEYGLAARRLSSDAVSALQSYAWPGNVREVSNTIERAVLLSEAGDITASMLGLTGSTRQDVAPSSTSGHVLREQVERFEREQLLGALDETRWNVSYAADRLGIPRNTLRYRMARYGLQPETSPPRRRKVAEKDSRALFAPPSHPSPATAEAQLAPPRLQHRQVAWLQVTLTDSPEPSPPWAGRALEILLDKVDSFGGVVQELTSRGMVAVFGLEPTEDAPRRAAHAGVAVQKAITRAPAAIDAPLTLKVVVNIAPAEIEETDGTRQLAAASLQDGRTKVATISDRVFADGVIANRETASTLERWFQLEAISAHVVDRNEQLYRVVWPGQSGHEPLNRRRSRFVGREVELVLLQERVVHLPDGRGEVIGIVGEPGSGKSRLLLEFRRRLSGQPGIYLEGSCLSHGSGVPYLPIVGLLRRLWNLDEADQPELIAATIREQLRVSGVLVEEHLPYILRLFGIAGVGNPLTGFSPEAIKRRTYEAIRHIILPRDEQVVLVIEDLHWVDKTSEEFLASVVDSTPGAPLLFVSTYRPGYRPPWIDRSYVSQLALGPLSAPESEAVVTSMRPDLSTSVSQAIVARAEGNPFFLEELALAVPDEGTTDHPDAVPHTIRDVLSARMDRLPTRLVTILETAAVLGREVVFRFLEPLVEQPSDLADHLQTLVQLEFLYGQRGATGLEYSFKHALIQEVAYGRLSAHQRNILHAGAGKALEVVYADRSDEVLDLLSYHYARTGDATKAIGYLTRFAQKATASYSLIEAVGALEQALVHAERMPSDHGGDAHVVETAIGLALPLLLLGRLAEGRDLLLRYQERITRLQNPSLTGPYYMLLAALYDHMGDHDRATPTAHLAIAEGTAAGDHGTVGKAYVVLAFGDLWTAQFRQGVEHAEQAPEKLQKPEDAMWRGMAYWILAWNHALLGNFAVALEASAQVRHIGQVSGDRRLESYGNCFVGWLSALRGGSTSGIEEARLAVELAPDPLARATVLGFLGEVLREAGDAASARTPLEESLRLMRLFQISHLECWTLCRLADAHVQAAQLETARELSEKALSTAVTISFPFGRGLAQRVLGRVEKAAGQYDTATLHFKSALEIFSAQCARYEIGRTLLDLAATAEGIGDRLAVATHLKDALRHFQELDLPAYVARIEGLAIIYQIALT